MSETQDPRGPAGNQDPQKGEYDEDMDPNEFGKPLSSPKAWLILGTIFVAIAVGILYVYQSGDTKTILGNQPIPTNQALTYAQPAALNVPGGGNLQRPPANDTRQLTRPAAPFEATTQGQTLSQCPSCKTTGLPLCSACGTVMQTLNTLSGSDLFVCPSCGRVGVMICPRCGSKMSASFSQHRHHHHQAAPKQAASGQFQCPACGATGLPNWDANGTPLCPNCNTPMTTRPGDNLHLAAKP